MQLLVSNTSQDLVEIPYNRYDTCEPDDSAEHEYPALTVVVLSLTAAFTIDCTFSSGLHKSSH